jgi:probable F420-dependent oxidoreductase
MKIGIICGGIGERSTGNFIARSARAAEEAGFSSYWLPEHVLLFGAYPQSTHPYAYMSGDKGFGHDPRVAWADPVVGMTWAAAATSTIEVGSSIVILPQRNPLVFAKAVATIDEVSGGRVAIGAGVGWCREEYEAIGADWAHRGKRMDEYIAVLRSLWDNDLSEFHGETISFENAYMYPKPGNGRRIPILLGGESEFSMKRVAALADGWNAINLSVAEAPSRIARLKELARAQGRDPDVLRIIVTIFPSSAIDDLQRYRDAGATEFNLMTGDVPLAGGELEDAMREFGRRFIEPAADW